MRLSRVLSIVILALVVLMPTRANAGPFVWDMAAGGLSAVATFDVSGQQLIVTLTNTSSGDPANSSDILTGLFFNVAGNPTLQAISADICALTCFVTNGEPTGIGTDLLSVAGEWAFRQKTDLGYGGPGAPTNGLSAVAAGTRFPETYLIAGYGSNQSGHPAPNGIDYGITTLKDTENNDKSSVKGVPLISNQVIFTLTGLPASFNIDAANSISNVQFLWGTGAKEVPEPATVLLLSLGGTAAMIARRRKARR